MVRGMVAERTVSSRKRNQVPSLSRIVKPPFGFRRPVIDRRPLWSSVKLRNVSGRRFCSREQMRWMAPAHGI
jgi:hypothetical protein